MKFRELKFLCDENVDPEVVDFLNQQGLDAMSAYQGKLAGKDDEVVLKKSYKTQRVLFTHDNDFGEIIYSRDADLIGVIFVRPGHFDGKYTINIIRSLLKADLKFEPPFILVVEQKQDAIKIRLRNNL